MVNQKLSSYGLATLSGILLLLSFPPFNLGGLLAWVALVPLLIAIYYEKSLKRVGRLAIVSCLIVFVPITSWFYYEFQVFIPPPFTLVVLLVSAIVAGVYSDFFRVYWKPKELPTLKLRYLPSTLQIFILPIVWTAFEFLAFNVPIIMKLMGGFGFFSIAKTQWLNIPIIQLASFTGMYGVTFLILSVNCAIACAITRYKEDGYVSKPAIAVVFGFLVIFTLGWLGVPSPSGEGIGIAIIQAPPPKEGNIGDLYVDLSEESLKYNPEIILWAAWMFEGPEIEPFANFSKEHDVYLTGFGKTLQKGPSIALVSPDGKLNYYNMKYHYTNLFDGIIPFNPDKAFWPEIRAFDTEFGKVGTPVCMETSSTFPTRKLIKGGAQWIMTNTGTIGFSFPQQIGSNVVYRAVEHRVPAAAAGPDEASIVVDPYGRIVNSVSTPEMVVGKLSFVEEKTFYTRYGDVFGWTIVLLFAALWVSNFYLKRKNPFKYCIHCNTKLKKDVKTCDKCGKKADERVLKTLWGIIPP
jgi:apolipoprotein N-acyltransferase